VGVCAAVFAVEPRGQRLSRARSADSLQRGSLHCADRQPVAFHTARLPAVAGDYQQMQCWMRAGCFERLVEDTRILRREFAGRKGQPTAVCIDSRTLQSTPESGARAGYDGAKRRKGSKVHIAVDTLGHLLALRVTAARSGRPRPGRDPSRGYAGHYRRHGRDGLCRSGLHRTERRRNGHRTTASGSKGSSTRWPGVASCCCRAAGLSREASPGPPDFADSQEIINDSTLPSKVSTTSPSPAS